VSFTTTGINEVSFTTLRSRLQIDLWLVHSIVDKVHSAVESQLRAPLTEAQLIRLPCLPFVTICKLSFCTWLCFSLLDQWECAVIESINLAYRLLVGRESVKE
jgi:uncharacterized protein with PQ loop repeat